MASLKAKHGLFIAFAVLIFVFQPHGTAATARKQLDATAAVREDPKPIWHRQFSIDFNGACL